MKTRQRTKAEYVSVSKPVWHLDLMLSRQDKQNDLTLLSSIVTPDAKLNVNSIWYKHKTFPKKNHIEVNHSQNKVQYNGRMTRGKKQLDEPLMIPIKRRLKTEAENSAVKGLYNLCKEIWDESSFYIT